MGGTPEAFMGLVQTTRAQTAKRQAYTSEQITGFNQNTRAQAARRRGEQTFEQFQKIFLEKYPKSALRTAAYEASFHRFIDEVTSLENDNNTISEKIRKEQYSKNEDGWERVNSKIKLAIERRTDIGCALLKMLELDVGINPTQKIELLAKFKLERLIPILLKLDDIKKLLIIKALLGIIRNCLKEENAENGYLADLIKSECITKIFISDKSIFSDYLILIKTSYISFCQKKPTAELLEITTEIVSNLGKSIVTSAAKTGKIIYPGTYVPLFLELIELLAKNRNFKEATKLLLENILLYENFLSYKTLPLGIRSYILISQNEDLGPLRELMFIQELVDKKTANNISNEEFFTRYTETLKSAFAKDHAQAKIKLSTMLFDEEHFSISQKISILYQVGPSRIAKFADCPETYIKLLENWLYSERNPNFAQVKSLLMYDDRPIISVNNEKIFHLYYDLMRLLHIKYIFRKNECDVAAFILDLLISTEIHSDQENNAKYENSTGEMKTDMIFYLLEFLKSRSGDAFINNEIIKRKELFQQHFALSAEEHSNIINIEKWKYLFLYGLQRESYLVVRNEFENIVFNESSISLSLTKTLFDATKRGIREYFEKNEYAEIEGTITLSTEYFSTENLVQSKIDIFLSHDYVPKIVSNDDLLFAYMKMISDFHMWFFCMTNENTKILKRKIFDFILVLCDEIDRVTSSSDFIVRVKKSIMIFVTAYIPVDFYDVYELVQNKFLSFRNGKSAFFYQLFLEKVRNLCPPIETSFSTDSLTPQ